MRTISRHGLARCPHCREIVRRTITEATGAVQLVNAEPDGAGNVVAYLDGQQTWRSRVPSAERPQAGHEKRFMPHAATCLRQPGRAVAQSRLPEGVVSLAEQRRRRRGPQRLF